MSKRFSLPLFLLLCSAIQLNAQSIKDEPIELKHCSINVAANMFTATTVMQMEFYNPNTKVLDGEYNFSLQAGQVVTGFALDINGFLREGVIVDKQQGRVAYENTIRRRIDPGLLEMTAGNNYRVRIYPMPAKGTRKIKIVIAELLIAKANTLTYNLPLDIDYTIKQLTVACAVSKTTEPPYSATGLLKGKDFENNNDQYVVSFTKNNLDLKQPLSFQIPLQQSNAAICYDKQQAEKNFSLHLKVFHDSSAVSPVVNSATIFWDVSASAKKRNISKEITFLQSFLKARKIVEVNLVTFSNTVHETRKIMLGENSFAVIKRFLEAQQFDGGTGLSAIDCSKYDTDIFLLFSDGLGNIGNDKIKLNGKPLYCINTSAAANHTFLKKMATASGAVYIDLSTATIDASIKTLQAASLQLLSVKQDGKDILVNTALPQQSTGWLTITGTLLNSSSDIVLAFGKEGKILKEEKVSLHLALNCNKAIIDTACLLQQYEFFQTAEMGDEKGIAFAKQHHFVSSATSFIVLDNVDDYIQYGIVPPSDLEQQYQQKVYLVKQKEEEQKKTLANEQINNLKKAALLYNDRIRWWSKDETLININEVEIKKAPPLFSASQNSNDNVGENEAANIRNTSMDFKGGNALSEVVVIGYGVQRKKDLTGSVTTINASKLFATGAQTIGQALQGKVAGVQIIESGMPGLADKIIIRGNSTLSGNNEPLYVLDGMYFDRSVMNLINVNDIESVSVIKGAQAAAIYGSRGANGVLVITSKRGSRNNYNPLPVITKYSDLEDMDYINELKEFTKPGMYQHYLLMKDSFETDASFYFDVAQLLFENDDKENALRVLSNLSEMNNENHQLLRAMGYVLENWKLYEQAIEVYKKVLSIKEEEPQSYRDLAMAYERNGQHQQAIEILYKVITKNFYQYEDRYRGIKSLLLNEMNSIISQSRCFIEPGEINEAVIKPLPVDIRIVVDWNKDETDLDLHIAEPGGEESFYGYKQTKSGGRLSEDFTQGYGPEEYEIKNAKKGKYSVIVNYYGDRYQKQQTPSFVKLTIYKNFGKPDQSVSIETFLMDNQRGKIEIAAIKYY